MMADEREPQLLVMKRGGRPRVAEPRDCPATTHFTRQEYDYYSRLALKHDKSLSSLIADLLRLTRFSDR